MNATNPALLDARHIHKTYPSDTGDEPLIVLRDVSLAVPEATVLSVIGSSGSGKSTLLHILGGLDRPDSGEVLWGTQRIDQVNEEELARHRNHEIGFVFQFHHLLPEFTALENIFMPALIAGKPMDEARERARHLLSRFGLEKRAEHRPTQLSGGEQQRVAMARALMNKPRVILADEPTGNLDEGNSEVLLDMLFELRDNDGVSIVLVTHEPHIARRTDKVFELSKGTLAEAAEGI